MSTLPNLFAGLRPNQVVDREFDIELPELSGEHAVVELWYQHSRWGLIPLDQGKAHVSISDYMRTNSIFYLQVPERTSLALFLSAGGADDSIFLERIRYSVDKRAAESDGSLRYDYHISVPLVARYADELEARGALPLRLEQGVYSVAAVVATDIPGAGVFASDLHPQVKLSLTSAPPQADLTGLRRLRAQACITVDPECADTACVADPAACE